MIYHPASLSLHPDKLQQLGRGISSSFSNGNDRIFLTARQLEQVKKGGAVRIRMTPHQFRYNLKHGGGIWDSIKSFAKKHLPAVKEFAITQAKKHLPKLGHALLNKAAAHPKLQHSLAKKGIDTLRTQLDRVSGTSRPAANMPGVGFRIGGAPVGTQGASTTYRLKRKGKKGGSFLLA